MSQLNPYDILIIQTSIEQYKRRYPNRPSPTAETALAWRLGREAKQKAKKSAPASGLLAWFSRSLRLGRMPS